MNPVRPRGRPNGEKRSNRVKKVIVLLSGGLDSATALYIAREEGCECHCLIFDYNQRHRKEMQKPTVEDGPHCAHGQLHSATASWADGIFGMDRGGSAEKRRDLVLLILPHFLYHSESYIASLIEGGVAASCADGLYPKALYGST